MQENEAERPIPVLNGWSDRSSIGPLPTVAAKSEIADSLLGSPGDRERFRLYWFGRKQGRLKLISDAWLKAAPVEAKRQIGQRFNALKAEIEQRLEQAVLGRRGRTGC